MSSKFSISTLLSPAPESSSPPLSSTLPYFPPAVPSASSSIPSARARPPALDALRLPGVLSDTLEFGSGLDVGVGAHHPTAALLSSLACSLNLPAGTSATHSQYLKQHEHDADALCTALQPTPHVTPQGNDFQAPIPGLFAAGASVSASVSPPEPSLLQHFQHLSCSPSPAFPAFPMLDGLSGLGGPGLPPGALPALMAFLAQAQAQTQAQAQSQQQLLVRPGPGGGACVAARGAGQQLWEAMAAAHPALAFPLVAAVDAAATRAPGTCTTVILTFAACVCVCVRVCVSLNTLYYCRV